MRDVGDDGDSEARGSAAPRRSLSPMRSLSFDVLGCTAEESSEAPRRSLSPMRLPEESLADSLSGSQKRSAAVPFAVQWASTPAEIRTLLRDAGFADPSTLAGRPAV